MNHVLIITILATGASALHGQSVRGSIQESDGGTPLRGAFVVLLDSAGVRRNAVLTGESGTYVLHVPSSGRYVVRAEMIGYETATSNPFAITSGEAVAADLRLRVAAIEMEALSVEGERRCAIHRETGGSTAHLWEEARKALTLTRWTEQQGFAQFHVRRYDRHLRLGSLELIREIASGTHSQSRPYRAVPADSLAEFGFVLKAAGDSTIYFGPDAEVLMSDPFLDTHCFRAVRGDGETRGLVGLAFEPERGRKVPDIKGTLWLDPKTSELRYVEFTYTGIPDELNARGVGGTTYFRRLENGAWLVDRWFLRMPVPVMTQNGKLKVESLLETGGELVDVRVAGSATAAISGVVHDSVSNRPLRAAMVYLSGTSHRATTDDAGHFTIDSVTSGKYTIDFSHQSFDSLPAWPESFTVEVADRQAVTVHLAVPSMTTLIGRVCEKNRKDAVISGKVGLSADALVDASITARYIEAETVHTVNARPDAAGRYVLCGLPEDNRITIQLNKQEPKHVRIGAKRYLRVDLGGL